MHYVYRYRDEEVVNYIGITNDLCRRRKQHERESEWFNDNLKYEYIIVDNEYIAQLFEEYLINRDKPVYNRAKNNKYDVSCIKFNIEENWKKFVYNKDERLYNKIRDAKLELKLNKKIKEEGLRREFDIELKNKIITNRDSIIKVYYDQYERLNLVFKSKSSYEELYTSKKWMAGYISFIGRSEESNIVTIQLKDECDISENDSYCREILNDIKNSLGIYDMDLDLEYGKKRIIEKTNKLETYYKKLIETDYKIIFISIKNGAETMLTINNLFNISRGIECVYRLPFAYYLKYTNRRNDNGILIHYEPTDINDISDEFKMQFKNQYYLKCDYEDNKLIDYMIYINKIPCRLMSGYPEVDEERGDFYISREMALNVSVD